MASWTLNLDADLHFVNAFQCPGRMVYYIRQRREHTPSHQFPPHPHAPPALGHPGPTRPAVNEMLCIDQRIDEHA